MIQSILQTYYFADANHALYAHIVYIFCSFAVFTSLGSFIRGGAKQLSAIRIVAMVGLVWFIFGTLFAIGVHYHIRDLTWMAPDLLFALMAAGAGFAFRHFGFFDRPARPMPTEYEERLEARLKAMEEEARIAKDRKRRPWMYHNS